MTKQEEKFGKCPLCGGGVNTPAGECSNSLHFATGAMGFGEKGKTKQEEIRNLIALAISECPIENVGCDGLAQHILNKLHSQGVVIKVEGKWVSAGSRIDCMNVHTINGLGKYVAVEPLIKEKQ